MRSAIASLPHWRRECRDEEGGNGSNGGNGSYLKKVIFKCWWLQLIFH